MSKIRQDICVSIGNIGFEEIKQLLPALSLAEIRIDLLNLSNNELRECCSMHHNLIATYRPNSDEYGLMKDVLIEAIESGAAWVDVDLDTPAEIIKDIAEKALSKNCRLIVSYHNYSETPTLSFLESIIENANAYHGGLTKIACMATSPGDSARVLSLYEKHTSLIAFCMGQLGTITRIASPLLGAPFTYASLPENQTAPGQIDYISMNNLLNTINPIP